MKRTRSKSKLPTTSTTSTAQIEELNFTPLGSGNEVGRSCHLLQFKNKRILLDCGLHPGKKGGNALPFFDVIEPETIDLVLISHFHVDHVAALPYFTEKTAFNGPIYMTRPTRVVSELLLKDYVRVIQNNKENDQAGLLFTSEDVMNCLRKCQVVDYHQVIDCNGIKFTPLFAGHVLGAAMFLIEISNVRVLYTGDFSAEHDRHLIPAEVPRSIMSTPTTKNPLDLLIMESTFGTMVHQGREIREKMFTGYIRDVVLRGGVCLIPVFSLGRAQELLLILEDHWKRSADLQRIKVYHYSHVASKALEVYRTYINVMNDNIRDINKARNPWKFDFIFPLDQKNKTLSKITREPCVVMASPGMLQNGLSRRIFEKICASEKNGVVLCGYSVEGTLAYQLGRESSVKFVQSSASNEKIPIRCSIEQVSFAAHSDVVGTRAFVNNIRPKNLILVHGDSMQMKRLRKDLGKFFTDDNKKALADLNGELVSLKERQRQQSEDTVVDANMRKKLLEDENRLVERIQQKTNEKIRIFMPYNTQKMILNFEDVRIIKVMGNLAAQKKRHFSDTVLQNPTTKVPVKGLLIRRNFDDILVDAEEVDTYTDLKTTKIHQQLTVPFHGTFDTLQACLSQLFTVLVIDRSLTKLAQKSLKTLLIGSCVFAIFDEAAASSVSLEWDADVEADIVADATVALLLQSSASAQTIQQSKCLCASHDHHLSADSSLLPASNDDFSSFVGKNQGLKLFVELLNNWFGQENYAVSKLAEPGDNKTKHGYRLSILELQAPIEAPVAKQEQMEIEVQSDKTSPERKRLVDIDFDAGGHLLNVNPLEGAYEELKEKILDLIETSLATTCPVLTSLDMTLSG